MKGRIILNTILVAAVFLSRSIFAAPSLQTRSVETESQKSKIASFIVNAIPQTQLLTQTLQNYAELAQKIKISAQLELMRQISASELLIDAVKIAGDYFKVSLIDPEGK